MSEYQRVSPRRPLASSANPQSSPARRSRCITSSFSSNMPGIRSVATFVLPRIHVALVAGKRRPVPLPLSLGTLLRANNVESVIIASDKASLFRALRQRPFGEQHSVLAYVAEDVSFSSLPWKRDSQAPPPRDNHDRRNRNKTASPPSPRRGRSVRRSSRRSRRGLPPSCCP